MIGRLAVFALLVTAQAPQTPARDTRALDVAPAGGASIAGVVVDHEQKPLRRVTVMISGPSVGRSSVTDDAGRFAFAALPAGRYAISARKNGYPQMNYGARQPLRTGSGVVVAEGQAVSGLTLTLGRGAVVEGTVYDDRGEPMPGVPLNVWEVRTALSGERTFTFPRVGGVATNADDRGRYRIYGLPPGDYTVGTSWFFSDAEVRVPSDEEIRAAFAVNVGAAAPPVAGAGRGTPPPPPQMLSYAAVFHPDSIDPLSARTFTLAAGEERTGVDIRMQRSPMSRIEATVVEADGTPATRAEVSLIRRSRITALNSTSVSFVSDGQYRSRALPQGDYGLVFTSPETADRPARSASFPITISSAEPIKLTATLQVQPPVTGTLVFEGAAPLPDKTRVAVLLRDAPGSFGNLNSRRNAVTAEGALTISGVSPGRYFIVSTVPGQPTTGPTGWMLRSVQADGRDVTDLPFEIAAGAPPALTLTFIDKISELSGKVVLPTGRPGTDFFVVVVPSDRQYWLPGSRRIASARPDVTGRYAFRALPAGEYRLAVVTELDSQDLTDISALEKLVAASVTIELGAGELKTFDIQLGGGGV